MVERIAFAQVALSVLTLLLSLVFFRSFLDRRWSLLAAFFVALSPHLIAANVYVLTETLFTMLLTGLLASLSWFAQNPRWWKALLVGFVLGAALLVRPTMQYFLVFLIPVLFLIMPWRRALTLGALITLGFVMVTGPWVVRNQSLPEGVHSSKALDTIHKGMYPDLMYQGNPETYGIPNRADPGWKQRRASSDEVLKEIRNRFTAEPARYLYWYIVGKPKMLLSWGIVAGMGDVFIYPVTESPYLRLGLFDLTHRLMLGLHWPITVLALAGCVLVWFPGASRRLSEEGALVARFASLVIAYFLLVHIAGTPLPRYAIPLRPLIFGLGVLGALLVYDVLVHRFPGNGEKTET